MAEDFSLANPAVTAFPKLVKRLSDAGTVFLADRAHSIAEKRNGTGSCRDILRSASSTEAASDAACNCGQRLGFPVPGI